MASFSSLEIGKRALMAQRFGLDVTSNNIANINTPGYSRRTAVMKETKSIYSSGTFMGTGVFVDKIQTYREEFFDREIRDSVSRKSRFEAEEEFILKVESVVAEPDDSGIDKLVNSFFLAFDDLALKPENVAIRENVISKGAILVDRLNYTSQRFSELRLQTLTDINNDVAEINKLVSEIGKINVSITNTKSLAGEGAQSLIDQREVLLEELAELTGVTATINERGSANLYINGINVLTGPVVNQIKVLEDINSSTGERTLKIVTVDDNDNIIHPIKPNDGKLAALLTHYNEYLDPNDSVGSFSMTKDLDEFANALVRSVNALTMSAYGLDDAGPVPPGRTFFEPSVGPVTAATISLSSDILGKPRDIPIADAPGVPGNNKIALQIAALSSDTSFLANSTPSDYYSSFIGKIGAIGNEASTALKTSELVTEQLSSQRESMIGVNLDEEAINLVRFQKAFEAASRVINTTNELLSTVINLGR